MTPIGSQVTSSYAGLPGFRDEAIERAGIPRGPWEELLRGLDALGTAELERRRRETARHLRENGVTYNVYGDSRNLARQWDLDVIPFVFGSDEWREIETGLIQRAVLFDHMLRDLYGPQKLIREGLLPPELVFANPGFLRPLHGAQIGGGSYLHFYAVDLARSPDGRWWVMGDRTQSPSGAGYALENRIITSRILPDLFQSSQVYRLAAFFRRVRETLLSLAPGGRENPRIVLLTPGPYNEAYFEHAFLARYLGYTLVEGEDLTIRDNHVFLRTLEGLKPVDVIIRRTDDDYCDPLELRDDSTLGVPGLVQAIHAGGVTVANILGSGLVETPAMMAFLPGLCRHFLGEELRIPSVATWWCGQEYALDQVRSNLSNLVIKGAFPSARVDAVFGGGLSAPERDGLLDRVASAPHRYVAQERITPGTAPVWESGKLLARHTILRAFLVASRGSYAVMPGGLTRVSSSIDTLVGSMQRGGGSKDTWVRGETVMTGPVTPVIIGRVSELSRGIADLPSRAAENLYWLGRYIERAESTVRLFRAVLTRIADESGAGSLPELSALLEVMNRTGHLEPEDTGIATIENIAVVETKLLARLFSDAPEASLPSTIRALGQISFVIRDRLSVDAAKVLYRIVEDYGDFPADSRDVLGRVLELMDRMIFTIAAFGGFENESMTRSHGWRFLDMGRRLERAVQMVELLLTTVVRKVDREEAVLAALLEIADSSMTYRSRYLTTVQFTPVLDLLLTDETNPRSVAFQLDKLAEHIRAIPRIAPRGLWTPEERMAMSMMGDVRLGDIERLGAANRKGVRASLERLLVKLARTLPEFSDSLSRRYLSHAEAGHQLVSMRPEISS